MSWVWQLKVKGTEKLVLLALGDIANDQGKCWPGIDTVTKKCGVSRNTVIRIIANLKKQGLIISEHRHTEDGRRTSNLYTLTLCPNLQHSNLQRCKNEGLYPTVTPEPLENHQTTITKATKKFKPPNENEVIQYFIDNGYSNALGTKAFRYYNEAEWKDGNGKQVRNWKQKMIANWFKEDNKNANNSRTKQNSSGKSGAALVWSECADSIQ